MSISSEIAKHLREFHFGGNWTDSNLKSQLSEVNWQEATTKIYDLNTIAVLAYHIHYFVAAVIPVLEGGELDAHDKYSFSHPPIESPADWEKMLEKIWSDAEKLATLVEQLPEAQLLAIFSKEKYGHYFRNMIGIIEHSHYHLGQIAVIKKILQQQAASTIT